MKIVYIASPYTNGDTAINVRNQILVAEQLYALGWLPYIPLMSHFWHFMSPHPYDYWMSMDIEWLKKATAVLRLPGESKGADKEVSIAEDADIPVFETIQELAQWGIDFKDDKDDEFEPDSDWGYRPVADFQKEKP